MGPKQHGREGREEEDCLPAFSAETPPPSLPLPFSLRRRQRCLRPLNPALERERTKEGENEGDRKEEDRQGREREGGKKGSSDPCLALSFFGLSSAPFLLAALDSFCRSGRRTVGRCECGRGATGRLVESLFSGGETFLLFYGSPVLTRPLNSNERGRAATPFHFILGLQCQTRRHTDMPAASQPRCQWRIDRARNP